MSGRSQVGDDLGFHGSWRFTREYVVAPELIALFHDLYETAFGPLRTRAMGRQVFSAEEFSQQMTNADVLKYVAWTREGDPVGLAALTNQLSTVPWISPEFFAARWPEHWARGAVWYFSFLLAHPSQRRTRFLDQLVGVGVDALLAQRAVLGYDMCGYNDGQLSLGDYANEIARRATGVGADRVDVQNYYAIDFDTRTADPRRAATRTTGQDDAAGTV